MRVTTRMVNDAAEKAGVPINSNSLLDYVKGNTNNNIMDTLQSSKTGKTSTSKTSFEKLEKTAKELTEKAELFTREGDDSIFAKAKESWSNDEICSNVIAMAERFNQVLKELQTSSSTMNSYYRKMLQETAEQHGRELSSIGISVAKDGTISVDKEKLKAASTDKLEKVLGGATGFASKLTLLADKISDHARANAESLSSQYQADGSTRASSFNKYDFWG